MGKSSGGGSQESAEARRLYTIQGDISQELWNWSKQHSLPAAQQLIGNAFNYNSGPVGGLSTQGAGSKSVPGGPGAKFGSVRTAAPNTSPGYTTREQHEAGIAQADVGRAFGLQREAQQRGMMRYGINPASGRFQGLTHMAGVDEAVARAGAGSMARRAVDAEAFNRQMAATGLASGQGAQAISGLGSAAGGLGSMAAAKQQANAQSSSGFWGGLGTLGGMALGGWLSSKDAKTDKRKTSDAKNLSKLKKLPVEKWRYKGDDAQHMGAYAEDFNRSFGLGSAPVINPADAIGATMSGLKGLATKVDRLERKVKGGRR